MATAKKKTAKKAVPKAGSKADAKKNKKTLIVTVVAIAVIICLAELAIVTMSQLTAPSFYYVQVAQSFSGDGQTCGPFKAWDVTAGKDYIAVCDQSNKRILVFDPQGHFKVQIDEKVAGPRGLREISCLTHDNQDNLYVIQPWEGGAIMGFGLSGKHLSDVDLNNKGFFGPRGVAWDNGNFVVADTGSHRLVMVSPDGSILKVMGQKGSGRGEFVNPNAIAVDAAGNFYVSDSDNQRIQCLDPKGVFVRGYDVSAPVGKVAVDTQGKVYAAEAGGNFVKVFDKNGKVLGKLVDAAHPNEPIGGIIAVTIPEDGTILAARGSEILTLHPTQAPEPAKK
jgi:hypothetical protein